MRIIITNESVYEWAAYYTVKCILDYSDRKKPFVLSFPLRYVDKSYYEKLLSFYNDNIVSFKNIHIVSSGEYIDSDISQKYLEENFSADYSKAARANILALFQILIGERKLYPTSKKADHKVRVQEAQNGIKTILETKRPIKIITETK